MASPTPLTMSLNPFRINCSITIGGYFAARKLSVILKNYLDPKTFKDAVLYSIIYIPSSPPILIPKISL
jgi:hypothetical protein